MTDHRSTESRQVSWWPVHEFITERVAQANNLPIAGTPAWCALADNDPLKLLALAAEGEHHVLRMETAQEARAEASRVIAGAADWRAISREIQQRAHFRAARPWLTRVTS
jgi:hypothetical protein